MLGGAGLDDAEPDDDPDAPGREAEEADGEDSDEFSSQGVEIEVTPAGKATRRLSLLSGGEKALVALAFVFAVFLARPSPFYILDEVEAALDDANIDRFLQLVDRFSDRAQFIIVTHQKRTMDAADVLYGVSMGKGGVTKVVSRRLAGATRKRRRGSRSRLSSPPARDGSWEEPSISATAGAAARRRAGARSEDAAVALRAPARAALEEPPGAAAPSSRSSLFDKLDDETWERLEEALILADVGAKATAEVVGPLEAEVEAGVVTGAEAIRERLVELLAEIAATASRRSRRSGRSRR